jgi:hypothetical protein
LGFPGELGRASIVKRELKQSARWQISSPDGHRIGEYIGDSVAAAFDARAKTLGYADHAEWMRAHGGASRDRCAFVAMVEVSS